MLKKLRTFFKIIILYILNQFFLYKITGMCNMILFENNKKFVNFIYLNLSLINIKKNLIIILFSIIMKFL